MPRIPSGQGGMAVEPQRHGEPIEEEAIGGEPAVKRIARSVSDVAGRHVAEHHTRFVPREDSPTEDRERLEPRAPFVMTCRTPIPARPRESDER